MLPETVQEAAKAFIRSGVFVVPYLSPTGKTVAVAVDGQGWKLLEVEYDKHNQTEVKAATRALWRAVDGARADARGGAE